MYTCLVVGY